MTNRRQKQSILSLDDKILMDGMDRQALWQVVRRTKITLRGSDDVEVKRKARNRYDYARGKIAYFENRA